MTSASSVSVSARRPGRVALASYVGTTIEYYDFFIYGVAAAIVFRSAFFPEFSELSGTLASLATFAVGFVARPLGGIIMGHLGDRIGRKSTLIFSLLTMGVATTLVGLLPTYETIGVWAPILLVVLRLVQGVGVGGEWAGAVLLAVESAPRQRRVLYGTFVQLGLPSGILLSQSAFLVLTAVLPQPTFLSWGWRIPFLVSAVLIVVGLVIRLKIEETSDFRRVVESEHVEKWPVVAVLRGSWKWLIVGGLGSMGVGAFGYLASLYMVQYGVTQLGLSNTTMLLAVTGVSLVWVFMTLAAGLAGDSFGRRRVFFTGGIGGVLLMIPLFPLVDTRSIVLIVVALVLLAAVNSMMNAPIPVMISEMFPASIRYSGTSLCYVIGSILGGGTTPIAATALHARFGSAAVSLMIGGVGLISVVAFWLGGMLDPKALQTDSNEAGRPESAPGHAAKGEV